jgi:hypothetical protein
MLADQQLGQVDEILQRLYLQRHEISGAIRDVVLIRRNIELAVAALGQPGRDS